MISYILISTYSEFGVMSKSTRVSNYRTHTAKRMSQFTILLCRKLYPVLISQNAPLGQISNPSGSRESDRNLKQVLRELKRDPHRPRMEKPPSAKCSKRPLIRTYIYNSACMNCFLNIECSVGNQADRFLIRFLFYNYTKQHTSHIAGPSC